MQTCLECFPCIVAQSKTAIARIIGERNRQEAAMREVLAALSINHWHRSPPYLVQQVHQIIRKWSDSRDPYRGAKQSFNRIALEMLSGLERQVRQATDPFEMAARIAIAANIIDLGIVSGLDEALIRATISRAISDPLAVNDLEALREAAAEAGSILYLGDNAGEIVFDRLLLGQLPLEKITFVVRGARILNDATLDDAQAAGLNRLVRVIDNGTDVPGTIPSMCSPEFQEIFARADLIIAKGQGNYETLSDFPHPSLFFLLKIKCPIVAASLHAAMGGLVAMRSRRPENSNEDHDTQAFDLRQSL
jgi:uncharacterized protein with ATP-grasp and redox domains